jgi:lambda family phage minor tail protein L
VRVANITGLVSALARDYNDLVGATLTRKRTFLRYLDAVNFAAGNPSADPAQAFADEVWFVDRKASENRVLVEFELAASFDLAGVKLPRRQVVQNVCAWRYRSAECSYAGGAVADLNDNPTTDLAADQCGKRLASCKQRFGIYAVLPFGGFPSCGLIR